MPVWAFWAIGGGLLAIGCLTMFSGVGLMGAIIDANSKGKLPVESDDLKRGLRKAAGFIILGCVIAFGSCGLIVSTLL